MPVEGQRPISQENATWRQRRPSWYIANVLGNVFLRKERNHDTRYAYENVYVGLGEFAWRHKLTGEFIPKDEYEKLK